MLRRCRLPPLSPHCGPDLANTTGVLVLDVEPQYTAAGDLKPLLNPDGLHPSSKGSQIAADYIYATLSAQ
jgi:lysophospholipase L1-like esterase